MKKIISLIISVCIICSCFFAVNVNASGDINIVIDGNNQVYDQMPVIVSDRTLVPLRGIFESLGATVTWYDELKMIVGAKDETTIVLWVNDTKAVVNDTEITLDVPAQIVSDRTMVPVRFISEAMGSEVNWAGDTRTVSIKSKELLKKEAEELRIKETQEAKEQSIRDAIAASKPIEDANLPKSGFMVVEPEEFVSDASCTNGEDVKFTRNGTELTADIKKKGSSDASAVARITGKISELFSEGDVGMMTFKAKLNSGGTEEGRAYIRAWVQSGPENNNDKSLYERTDVVTSEWTTCYLPFTVNYALINAGLRLGGAKQNVTVKDFMIINYKDTVDVTTLPSTIMAKTPSKPKEEQKKEEVPQIKPTVENITDNTLPVGGTVVVNNLEFMTNTRLTSSEEVKFTVTNDEITADIITNPEKDNKVTITTKTDMTSRFNIGDICVMTFKAKLNSGGQNGEGYIKAWVQAPSTENNAKSLFDRTKVTSEWTTCYLPFKITSSVANAGLRLGGFMQNISIKDFSLINYGSSVDFNSLPSTIIK